MSETAPAPPAARVDLDVDALRSAIREEYETVALDPGRGFHFHTGRALAAIVGDGTKGINFRARKPANEAELDAAFAALRCEADPR